MAWPCRKILLAGWLTVLTCVLNAGCITVQVPAGAVRPTVKALPFEAAPVTQAVYVEGNGVPGVYEGGGGCSAEGGCLTCGAGDPCPLPKELRKVSLPDYIVEPPDILYLTQIKGSPLPPYRLEVGDLVQVQVADALPDEPLSGLFTVEPEGTINLGLSYGAVRVAGMTTDQARLAIRNHLRRVLKEPQPVVALAESRAVMQLVAGEHLIRPDGTISLGVYGCIYVAGMNLKQVQTAIEQRLSQYLLNPQVSVDVQGFNSKVYYVIYDGGGFGQQIFRMPITGNETVLDALSSLGGLPAQSSKKKIWVARPAPPEVGCDQILPVDWNAITQGGSTATNYQLLPGDRIYVKADCLIAIDNALAKFLAPIERLLGFTLLGTMTARTISNFNNNNGGAGFGFVAVP